MDISIAELQERLVTLEGVPISNTWQLDNGVRKLEYNGVLTMPNHLHAPRGIGSKYSSVFQSQVFLLSDLLLITKPYSQDRTKLVLLSDPLDLDQCNVTHVFYNDDCEFAVEENTLDKDHAAHTPKSSAAEDITVQVFGFRTTSAQDKTLWVERLHRSICAAKGMPTGKRQSHLNLLEFRRQNSTNRLRAATKGDPFAAIPGLHERSHTLRSQESSKNPSRRNSLESRSRSNSRAGSQRKLVATPRDPPPPQPRRRSSGVKRTASKDGIKVYTRPLVPVPQPTMSRRRSLLLDDDEDYTQPPSHTTHPAPTSQGPGPINSKTKAMAKRFSQDVTLVAPPVGNRPRQGSSSSIGHTGKTKVKDLAEAFIKSASKDSLVEGRRPSQALSSDRLLPKEGHTTKVTERLLAAQRRSSEMLKRLPSSEAVRDPQRRAIQEGTHRRLLTKFEEEQQRLHELQLAAEKQNADWQKQEVRAAYATGHDYFAKFGLGVEPEPLEAPPKRKTKRMSFDIPKTDRNVANLIAQLTTATDEELKLVSESVQQNSPAKRPSAAMADILSWDYTDDMAFDALPEVDEEERDILAEPSHNRRRSSVVEPMQDPTTPLSLSEATISEVAEEEVRGRDHPAMVDDPQGPQEEAAPSREKVSLLRRVWSGRAKRSPLMRKASRIKRRGKQIQVPTPVDANDDEARPGTATLRAARRSVWSSASSATRRSSLVSLASLAERTDSNTSPRASPSRSPATTPIDGTPLSEEVKELLVSLQGQAMAPAVTAMRTDSSATITSNQGSSRTLQDFSTQGSGVVNPRSLNQAHTVLTAQSSNRASLHELELSRLNGSPTPHHMLDDDIHRRGLSRLERRVSSSMPIEDLLKQALEHQDSGSTLILSEEEQAARKLSNFSHYSLESQQPQSALPTVDLSFLNLSPHRRGLSPLTLPPKQHPRLDGHVRRARRSTLAPSSMPLGQYLKQNWETLMVPQEEAGGRLRRRRPSIEDLLMQEKSAESEEGGSGTLLGKLRRQVEKDGDRSLGLLAKRGQEWTGDLCKDVYGLPKDRVKHLAQTRKPKQVSKLETKLTSAGISRQSSFAAVIDETDENDSVTAGFGPGQQAALVKQLPVPTRAGRAPRVLTDEVLAMYHDDNKVAHPADPLPSALRWMLPEVSQLEAVTAFQARALAVLHASNLLSGITCDL
eukprot:m.128128 g.128128  ORF g.128128 m.128128 type:complete len:1181 (+) comp15822_c0_seq1:81-3623(+)